MTKAVCRWNSIGKRFFRKMKIFFDREHLRNSFSGLHEVRFLLPQRNSSEFERQHLYDHIMLWRSAGFQVRVEQLNRQITGGYIAQMNYYYEGQLKSRTGLQILTGYAVAKHVFFQQEDLSNQKAVSS